MARRLRQLAPCALMATIIAAPLTAGDTVERRGGLPPVSGRIVGMDDAGVTVKSDLGATHFVSWDRVRDVKRDTPDHDLDRKLERATELWRARTRVERHDTALAEPLLVRLAETYEGRTHETARVVVEGLLRCRLARAAHASAVVPALEVLRLERAGVATDAYAMLPRVLDETHGLCPALAPVWIDDASLARLEHELESYDAQGDELVAALARQYRVAARRKLGMAELPAADIVAPEHPGARLLELVVACDALDDDARNSARERLLRSIEEEPGWAEAWIRFHVGRSLMRETGIGRQERGLVQLAHVPARFERRQPFLAGVALELLAQGLESHGDAAAAASVRAEAARRLPHHPLHGAPGRTTRINDRTRS